MEDALKGLGDLWSYLKIGEAMDKPDGELVEDGGTVMKAQERLPRELVSQVIREVFAGAYRTPCGNALADGTYTGMIAANQSREAKAADLACFTRIRLVASHIRAEIHAAWPGGLALLATSAAKQLLVPGLSTADLQRALDLARPLLAETTSLSLTIKRREGQFRIGDNRNQAAYAGLKQVVASTRALRRLRVDFQAARIPLATVSISHLLHLRELHLDETPRNALVGLDLSSMQTLDILTVTVTASYNDERATQITGFRLPPKATFIRLSKLELSSDQVDMLRLGQATSLRRFEMWRNRLTRPLPAMHELKELKLDDGSIDDAFLRSLATWRSLEALDVPQNAGITSASPLRLGLNTSLARLNVSGTGIQDPGTFELASNKALRLLILDRCKFTTLNFGLASNSTLRELQLDYCQLTVPLMQQLVGELSGNSTLSKLQMQRCGLSDKVVAHFKLQKTSGLQELVLSANDFSENGLQPLADSIQEHGLLRTLDLCYCVHITPSFAARYATSEREVKRSVQWD